MVAIGSAGRQIVISVEIEVGSLDGDLPKCPVLSYLPLNLETILVIRVIYLTEVKLRSVCLAMLDTSDQEQKKGKQGPEAISPCLQKET